MRRFFIAQALKPGDRYILDGTDANHIKNVLRMQPGDEIRLFDARQKEYTALIESLASGAVEVRLQNIRPCLTESPLHITVGQALLKNKKMDTLVRQLTETGINRWIPFAAERSVAKTKSQRLDKQLARWRAIARESLKQCERGLLPEISPPVSFDELLTEHQHHDLNIIFTDKSAAALASVPDTTAMGIKTILILIGPEGGFTPREIDRAKANGFVPAALGARILKADTATIVACAILQHRFGDI